jgi:hypothetical protein
VDCVIGTDSKHPIHALTGPTVLFDFHLILGAILLGVPEQLFVGSSPIEVGFPKIDRTAIPSDSYANFSALVRHRHRRVFFHCALFISSRLISNVVSNGQTTRTRNDRGLIPAPDFANRRR